MCGAFGDDLTALTGHEIKELVDQEGRGEGSHTPRRDPDGLATDGAAEGSILASMGGHDARQAVEADRVGTVEQLWSVFPPIEGACPCQSYSDRCCSVAAQREGQVGAARHTDALQHVRCS